MVDEGRVDHRAPPARLAHGKGQVAVIPVQEAVSLVEAPHRLEHRPREAQADTIHHRDLRHVSLEPPLALERVDDGPADVAAVSPEATHAVETGQPDAPR